MKKKILENTNCLTVGIPKIYAEMLDLKKGTDVEVILDYENKQIIIKK